jgi:two-component system, chemotaxis family, protein-glutamate methylesterase/glutaminase
MKILVVDDARMMRRVISDVVIDAGHEVVGEASNGTEAVMMAQRLKPDLITLDIEMPGMSGLDALRQVMKTQPTKVLLVSSLTTAGADITLEGLSLGAVDFVPKPSALTGLDGFTAHLADALKAAGFARLRTTARPPTPTPTPTPTASRAQAPTPIAQRGSLRRPSLIVVASSTGGPDALTRFFAGFRSVPACPVLVVQHMPAEFTGRLAQRLDAALPFTVREAADGERTQPGTVLIAPGDRHLGYTGGRVRLLDSPPIGRLRPAADITLEEVAADAIGPRTLVVVLSGMGKDGLIGAQKVVGVGGQLIAQDAESCAVDGMPRTVREAGLAMVVGPPEALAANIETVSRRGAA